MSNRSVRWAVWIAIGVGLAVGGCKKGGAAGAGAPSFVAKELTFQHLRIRASVPEGWHETREEGVLTEYVYAPKERMMTLANRLKVLETCDGNCGGDLWRENASSSADDYLKFVNDPSSYMPAAVGTVVENGEVEPGKYVFVMDIVPKEPSKRRGPETTLQVWRYSAEWPRLIKFEITFDADTIANLDAFKKACLEMELLEVIDAE